MSKRLLSEDHRAIKPVPKAAREPWNRGPKRDGDALRKVALEAVQRHRDRKK